MCGTECCFDRAHQRWMQDSQFWRLTMWRGRRDRKPLGGVRQIKHLPEIKLGVVTQARRGVGDGVALPQNGELTAMQGSRTLTRAVRNTNIEPRRVVVKYGEYQRGARLGAGMDLIREVAPNNFAGRRFAPVPMDHAVSVLECVTE
jgi:hypothetical protein